ncbi:MAG: hypothetical protein WC714_28475 [Candidatus Obscuribacterales bacterium]|jgi:hypothetical protein
MITITEQFKLTGNRCEYALCINDEIITTFKHSRIGSMGDCLRAAAGAYDTYEQSVIVNRYLDGGR